MAMFVEKFPPTSACTVPRTNGVECISIRISDKGTNPKPSMLLIDPATIAAVCKVTAGIGTIIAFPVDASPAP